ncbi:MAG: DUF1580 domain-containing protein [Phycisphaerae bacterium]
MAINLFNDELLTLSQAAKWIGRRTGKVPHLKTIHRWATRGLRGGKLETIRPGGVIYTTERALEEFSTRIPLPVSTLGRKRKRRQQSDRRWARKVLDNAGIKAPRLGSSAK